MAVIDAIQSVLSILIMVSIGYILSRMGWLDEKAANLFSRLVVRISLPALMLSNLIQTFDKDKLMEAGIGLLIPLTIMVIMYVISMGVSRLLKVPLNRRGSFQCMFAFSNTIFVGLPINLALFGDQCVPYVLMYYIGNTFLFWTIGVYGIRQDSHDTREPIFTFDAFKRIFSPPFIAFLVSIVLILLEIPLPKFIMDASGYIGNLTTPLSMLFIGIIIYSIDIRSLKIDKSMIALLLGRFALSPFLVLGCAALIPKMIPELMRKVFVIQASMPVMTQTAIVTKAYGADHEYAAVMVTITTAASLLIIPFYMYILS